MFISQHILVILLYTLVILSITRSYSPHTLFLFLFLVFFSLSAFGDSATTPAAVLEDTGTTEERGEREREREKLWFRASDSVLTKTGRHSAVQPLSLRTPLKWGHFSSKDTFSFPKNRSCTQFNLWWKDTSLIWTLSSVPLVSGLEEFHCIMLRTPH